MTCISIISIKKKISRVCFLDVESHMLRVISVGRASHQAAFVSRLLSTPGILVKLNTACGMTLGFGEQSLLKTEDSLYA